jgi:hypothetical protein
MDFLVIMFFGTLITIWAVVVSRTKKGSGVSCLPPVIPPEVNPPKRPEIWQYRPMDNVEHAEATRLNRADPVRNPFPLPVFPRED